MLSIQQLLAENGALYDDIAAKNNGVTSSFNFSNVGKYKFPLKYEKSEILELFCTGSGWANVRQHNSKSKIVKRYYLDLRVLHALSDNRQALHLDNSFGQD